MSVHQKGRTKVMRRISSKLFVVTLAFLLLACTTMGLAKVKIVFSDEFEYGPQGFKVFEELVKEFEKQNPDIEVEFQPFTGGDWQQRIIAQCSAGKAPDVFVAYGDFGRVLIENEQLLPLEDHFTDEDLADFYDGQMNAFWVKGHLYEIPKYVSTIALAYNKDIFDAAGVPYPGEDWNWDDFLAAAKKVTEQDPKTRQYTWGFHAVHNYMWYWVWQNGGEVMDEDFRGTKSLLGQPESLEAMQFVHDLIWEHKVAPKPADVAGKSLFDTFLLGNIAMSETHSWQLTDYVARAPFDWDVTYLPKGRTGQRGSVVFADGYGVYKGTKHPEAAIRFLKFITSPYAEEVMCTSILSLQPSRKSVAHIWDTDSTTARAGKNAWVYTKTAEFARLDPYFINDAKVREIRNPILEQIYLLNKISVEEGIRQYEEKLPRVYE